MTPAFASSRSGYPLREGMSEATWLQVCQGDVDGGQSKFSRNRWPRKKHGEVAFPTQVRYDIVIVIRPIFIISALLLRLQGTCHI